MSIIKAPFTEEQIKSLEEWQKGIRFHPFTCCSHDGCDRNSQPNNGELIPTKDGLICPCGKWKQDWCHDFMVK